MSALVAAELLKFRTTRTAIGILLAALALTAIGAAGTVGTANEAQRGTTQLSRDILSSSLFAALVAFLAGILCVTVEWRHGTVTRTLLVTPRRGRVLVAKELWVVAFSAILAAFALLLVVLIAVPWLAVDGASFAVDGHVLALALRILVAAALWGALGVGFGAIVQSQTPALVGAVLWILLVEHLVAALLDLVGVEAVGDYLPGQALAAFDGTDEGGLSTLAGGGVALLWVVALGVLGYVRMSRQDVT